MKIKVLVDNNTLIDKYYLAEPAISYYIETDGKKILFDLGYSDIFILNAEKMRLDLLDLDFIIFSHGHNDHTGGLKYLTNYYSRYEFEFNKIFKTPEIVSHPFTFSKKVDQGEEIGININMDTILERFKLNLTKNEFWINDRLVFLGEIKRVTDFEGKESIGTTYINNIEYEDFILDDSALVYRSPEGLVIITGCSHSGICNIIEHAKTICKDDRIIDIIGGFHLLNPNKYQLSSTLKFLKECKVKQIHACHCTDLSSKVKLSEITDVKEVGVGLDIYYE